MLRILEAYRIRATFFLNGDFIRRNPDAVRTIADAGHEVGNLFHTYFDMSLGQFEIDIDFILEGLSRTEGAYYDLTGREMRLIWHAPFYYTSPELLSAAQRLNYSYVGRDVESFDWIPKRDDRGIARLYKPTAELIEDIINRKQPGSIINITLGKASDDRIDGGRDDYLFHRLDVLINALLERGYEVVPISTLMDNAN